MPLKAPQFTVFEKAFLSVYFKMVAGFLWCMFITLSIKKFPFFSCFLQFPKYCTWRLMWNHNTLFLYENKNSHLEIIHSLFLFRIAVKFPSCPETPLELLGEKLPVSLWISVEPSSGIRDCTEMESSDCDRKRQQSCWFWEKEGRNWGGLRKKPLTGCPWFVREFAFFCLCDT